MSESDTGDQQPDEHAERLTFAIGNILQLTVNEFMLMAQLEAFSFFKPMPANIDVRDGSDLYRKLEELGERLGGPPSLIYRGEGEPTPKFDTYVDAAIHEAITTFGRARTAVCRAQIYLTGSYFIRRNPECMNLPDDPEIRRILIDQTAHTFWEHAETAYIRLASHWDRVGQILDFAFFNIRQFDRDGFAAVVERVHTNVIPVNDALGGSESWKGLRRYQTSEQPDGLKWLLRRRNLLVHSLHLSPQSEPTSDDPIFQSAYNHLDAATRDKLKTGTPSEELHLMHTHLSAAAELFSEAVNVALLAR